MLIHTLAEQGLGLLGDIAPHFMRRLQEVQLALGTHLAFWCNDGEVTSRSSERLRQRCRTWLGEAYDDREAEPLRSDLPALIMTGEFDPRTPPAYARLLAAGLPRAQLVILPWDGHLDRPPDCSFRISRDFFDAPDRVADTSCLDAITPIEFVTGVRVSRRVGSAVPRTSARPWLAALPGAAAPLLLVPPSVSPCAGSARVAVAGGAPAAWRPSRSSSSPPWGSPSCSGWRPR